MNLITKLIEKIKAKKIVDFENFDAKYNHNQSLVEKKFKKMQRGVNKLWDRTAIDYFVRDPFEEVNKINAIMMQQTKSKSFSYNFAHIIVCAKMYAANYMTTDEGKTYKEIKFACERLCEMVDSLNFNFMAHVNYETEHHVKLKNDSFGVEPDSYASRLVEMINSVNNNMMGIAEGIYKQDKDAVYNSYLALCNENLYYFDDGAKEIFEL